MITMHIKNIRIVGEVAVGLGLVCLVSFGLEFFVISRFCEQLKETN
jgi:hypothetical protein